MSSLLTQTAFSFELHATDGEARAGTFQTPHATFETPVFMPVGTHSAVRTLTHDQVLKTGAKIMLANAYHLYLRPGHELVEKAGGLHGWMNWPHAVLTDSGGFQVFSLANHRKIEAHGVWFKNPVDGNKHFIGPKESMTMQNALGADIIMAFDECPPYPVTYEKAKASLDLTHRWLSECFEHHKRPNDQALFPIVQGSVFEDLRRESAAFVQQFNPVGYAIGGVSVGEPREEINHITRYTAPLLPKEKPRYLMGVGTPEDLLDSIANGIDMFDCVMPTRIARHGSFFSPDGRKIIKNAEFTEDFNPLVDDCPCHACQNHSRAYIRHLYRQDEGTAKTLLSIHNITQLMETTRLAREAIMANRFNDFYSETKVRLAGHNS